MEKEVESATDTEINPLYGYNDEHSTYDQKLRLTNRATKSEIKYHFFNNQLYKINIRKDIKYYKESILSQLLKSSYFSYKQSSVMENLKNSNKYLYDDNSSMIFLYTNKNTLRDSDNLHIILGYKPIINKMKNQNS